VPTHLSVSPGELTLLALEPVFFFSTLAIASVQIKYLLDVSAEIQQQSSFLEMLERRLEAAKKLHGDALDLKNLYESRTVATMKDLRSTSKAVPVVCRGEALRPFDFSTFAAASTGQRLVQRGRHRDG
jgi:hypothetical protein